ncbi:RDD family protein [Nonomuraea sp. NPDC046570]|uniref:RDD family protein n=1 Tax=Nonomuraea sp. NPDC046570 TaxID=3155255 RepID=UPI0033D56FD2
MGSPPSTPPLAGRWRRLFAGILDAIIVSLVATPFTWTSWQYVWDADRGIWERYPIEHTFVAAVLAFLYFWLFHAYWHGQTPSKKLFHMRVVQVSGRPITVGQAAIRQLVFAVLAALCCLGIVDLAWILFDPRKQALHDKAAGTLVVDA